MVPILLILALALVQPAVPLQEEPRHQKVLENRFARVFDVQVPPGDASLYHRHSHDSVFVTLSGAKIWTESSDGARQDSQVTTGEIFSDTSYAEEPLTHRLGNHGDTLFRFIGMEVLASSPEPEIDSVSGELDGLVLELEDENVRAYRIQLEPGEQTGHHAHHHPGVLVHVSGEGDRQGTVLWIPAGQSHAIGNTSESSLEIVEVVWR